MTCLFNWLKEQFWYCGLTADEYNAVLPRILDKNIRSLQTVSLLSVFLFGGISIASFFVPAIAHSRTLYLSAFFPMLAIWALGVYWIPKHRTFVLPMCYLALSISYIFGIILGVPLQPDIPATTFCVLLCTLPLLLVDRPARVILLQISVTVVFCLSSLAIKDPRQGQLDLVNGLSFLFLGATINYFLMKTKVNDLQSRVYIERERDTDALTQLMTKTAFRREVERYMHPGSGPAALLMLDLDDFKKVNDTLGHAYGDAMLHIMGSCIQKTFRQTDLLARFGGDEFVMFLPGMQKEAHAEARIAALIDQVQAQIAAKDNSIRVTSSVGIAFYPQDAEDFDSLFIKADQALYHSKKNGKNQYTFYVDSNLTRKK